MIKNNQKLLNQIQLFVDMLIVVFSYIISYYLRFDILQNFPLFKIEEETRYYTFPEYAKFLLILVPIYLISYVICGMYKPRRKNRRLKELEVQLLLIANAFGLLLFMVALFMVKIIDFSRGFLFTFFAINISIDFIFRLIVTIILQRFRKKGFNQKHVLMVGYSYAAEGYIDRISANPQWGYHIFGILDDTMEVGTRYKMIPVIGNTQDLEVMLANNDFDEIAVTLNIDEYIKLKQIVGICEKSGVHTKFIPDYHNIIPTIPCIEDLNGLPVINIRNVPLSNGFNKILKRAMDLIGAAIILLIAAIPMILVAIIIKLTSPGPIIFSQVRVGFHNKEFKMFKFRSMEVQPEKKEKNAWTTKHDPRVTKIGKIIRRTSIDELPQLFNVLIGDMSLIGPRPERPFFVEKFKEEIPRYMIKHQVRPGMTGWAQVNGFRGDTSIRKRIECDLYYIENWTLGLDFKILFLTILKGFINKNAY